MSHIVKCRICKQQFDTNLLSEEEWCQPTPRYYYHTKCYEDWKNNRNNVKASNSDENFWYESLVDYMYQDLKIEMDFAKFYSQWQNYLKSGKYTPKGIYFTIRYCYEVQHYSADKAQGGIGIVPLIYGEAAQYWVDLENRKIGTMDAIIAQIKEREARPVIEIKKGTDHKKMKSKWSLDNL